MYLVKQKELKMNTLDKITNKIMSLTSSQLESISFGVAFFSSLIIIIQLGLAYGFIKVLSFMGLAFATIGFPIYWGVRTAVKHSRRDCDA